MSFEKGGTCVLAWKRRDGLGGSILTLKKKWEQRWIFMADGQISYYQMGDEDKLGEADFMPRGKIDLRTTTCRVEVTSHPSVDAPTPNEVEVISEEIISPSAAMAAANKAASSNPGGGGGEKPRKPTVTKWRLCFDSQQALVEFLEKAHAILETTGQLEEKDSSRFEHEFQPADHIYRWEMIVCPPVIYPIQIHGIVLEAGRNCVVVADFGLTGYGKKSTKDDFHHASKADKDQHNKIVTAFKKLRPNSDQRLHITTLTDPMDIRKWTKAHYDEKSYQKPDKLKNITKLFNKVKLSAPLRNLKDEITEEEEIVFDNNNNNNNNKSTGAPTLDHSELTSAIDQLEIQHEKHPPQEGGNDKEGATTTTTTSTQQQQPTGPRQRTRSEDHQHHHNQQQQHHSRKRSPRRTQSEDYAKQRQEEHPLPKADPKDIVLSRANFLLEQGEEKLPPYHVFYSNSECIAVWCKTGRWSTLQTAVFLSSNAIGGAKSATVATIGVAAAHAILAPVVAVGGLLWVSAPMVILQKSRERWETNTQLMTDLYWQWAPPKVYVCAIEHWSELGYHTQELLRLQQQQQKEEEQKAAARENGGTMEIKKYSSQDIMERNLQLSNSNGSLDNDHDNAKDQQTLSTNESLLDADKECKLEH